VRIDSIEAAPLSVPLVDPFVIAAGRLDNTRSVLVTVRAEGRVGLGEAASLPPVTIEDQPDVLATVAAVARDLAGVELAGTSAIAEALSSVRRAAPVACAGIESALVDALARFRGVSARALLGGAIGEATRTLVTDITLPILGPDKMAELARAWRWRGFSCFKVKVGKDLAEDMRALEAIARAVSDARFRIDANAGFSAKEAIALAQHAARLALAVECYEQPCAADDLEGMAEVARVLDVPVIADESVATEGDLARVRAAGAADGINLKLAKSGGPIATYALGRAAREASMPLMFGGMLETRLGMSAAAHVACALGGVEFVDLDTAWLLAHDPFEGGYAADGPIYTLHGEGFGVITSSR
jgi:L-alanine-DL-glutamate epimerase-like enolase superfamily enzyme